VSHGITSIAKVSGGDFYLKEAIESKKYSFDENVFYSSLHTLLVLKLSFHDAPEANAIIDLLQTLEEYFKRKLYFILKKV